MVFNMESFTRCARPVLKKRASTHSGAVATRTRIRTRTARGEGRAPARPDEKDAKLAQRMAEAIAGDVARKGWRVGAALGNEADLVARYGTSRWAVREALALLERDGLVEIRRGRAGGAYVAEPAAGVVTALLRNYLEFARVGADDIIAARAVLEELAMNKAAARLAPADETLLRSLLDRVDAADGADSTELGFHLLEAMYGAAKNPVLKVFLDALAQFTIAAGLRSGMTDGEYSAAVRDLLAARCAQARAVLGGEPAAMQASLRKHLRATRAMLSAINAPASGAALARARARALATAPFLIRGKRADALAEQIEWEIVSKRWPIGWHIGSEPELLEKYAISRSVFREAVRILEQNGAVEMRRGRHSGLKVSAPRPDLLIARARSFLIHAHVRPDDIAAVQEALDRAASPLICARDDAPALGERLRTLADEPHAATSEAWSRHIMRFYGEAIDACPNAVLQLMLKVLVSLAPALTLPRGAAGTALRERVHAMQMEFARAVGSGDGAAARRAAARLRESLNDPTRRI
jgi:DNA-binding FadR family transcriptional regulator